jgi:hypothetical protein
MSAVSAQDATRTHFCKQPGCTNEAKADRGPSSYCDRHRAARAALREANGTATHVAALASLAKLAKQCDRAVAKATKARKLATDAEAHAVELERAYRRAVKEATS